MHRWGRTAALIGFVLTLLGIVFGFGAMFAGHDGWAKPLITLIPVGFLLLFAGVTTALLATPEGDRERREP
jgi:uncharacterized membrane protein